MTFDVALYTIYDQIVYLLQPEKRNNLSRAPDQGESTSILPATVRTNTSGITRSAYVIDVLEYFSRFSIHPYCSRARRVMRPNIIISEFDVPCQTNIAESLDIR